MKYPHAIPALKYIKNPQVRARVERCFSSRAQAAGNVKLMEEVLVLRHQLAQLLGYATHADYVLETRMAKNQATARAFLENLKPRLDKLADKELAKLLELKKKEEGESSDGVINAFDMSYYTNVLLETEYKVDDDKIKQYFPLDHVLTTMHELYENMLSIKFIEDKDAARWHPDVRVYRVHDSNAEGPMIAWYFLDLFPREGKYGHAACFPMQPSCQLKGKYQIPSAAMICNFTAPTKSAPSLLRHSEVVTLFHELGHEMHNVCSLTETSRFRGTSVERDFVEAPSQFLENWCFERDVLKKMSHHHVTNDPLPDDMIDKLIAARNANSGLLNLRQLFFGLFDQHIHSSAGPHDTEKIYGEMRTAITRVRHTPGTNPSANFAHLMGGYDAAYYSYLWSEVYSAEMFEWLQKNGGVFSKENGQRYRRAILSRGGSVDAEQMLTDFLGRKPGDLAPFLRHLGLSDD